MTITLPPGVVILNVALPSQSTSTFPDWARSCTPDSARVRATTSAPHTFMTLRRCKAISQVSFRTVVPVSAGRSGGDDPTMYPIPHVDRVFRQTRAPPAVESAGLGRLREAVGRTDDAC